MIQRIESPNELNGGLYRMYSVQDEAEAVKILSGRVGYVFNSRVITALYLFVPINEDA